MPRTSPAIHTPETLASVIEEIAEACEDIKVGLETMRSRNIEELRVETGQAELTRALKGLRNFGAHLKRAATNARHDRGDFGRDANGDQPPTKRPKKSA